MKRALTLLLVSALCWFSAPAFLRAEKPAPITKDDGEREGRKYRDVSPDGKFALLVTYEEDEQGDSADQLELLELASKKSVAKIDWDDAEFRNGRDVHLLWAPDSQRVAVHFSHRRGGWASVFAKAGESFRQVKLPKFPVLPDSPSAAFRKKHPWKYVKVLTITDEAPQKWLKSGALVIVANVEHAGSTGNWYFAHTLTIGFDAKGRAVLEKTEKEEKLIPD